jgi:geranylgeranyl diphosphate synthase, type II
LSFDLDAWLKLWSARADQTLDRLLPAATTRPESLHQAMRYSVFSGGKRFRPALCVAGCAAVAGDPETALTMAAAIEMVHSYSLIHDDLPAIDNDDLRRGQPTCHKKFGEAVAIHAGDALLTEAFAVIVRDPGLDPWLKNVLVAELAAAAGAAGMVGGQVVDIEKEGAKFSENDLEYIDEHKTAKMIALAVASGGIIGNGSAEEVEALRTYGRFLGLAFQITDDVLNETGGKELGKGVGTDRARGKATYPALLGLEESRARALQFSHRAIQALERFNTVEPLRALAQFVLERKK